VSATILLLTIERLLPCPGLYKLPSGILRFNTGDCLLLSYVSASLEVIESSSIFHGWLLVTLHFELLDFYSAFFFIYGPFSTYFIASVVTHLLMGP
jgi:hypothetical protein